MNAGVNKINSNFFILKNPQKAIKTQLYLKFPFWGWTLDKRHSLLTTTTGHIRVQNVWSNGDILLLQ